MKLYFSGIASPVEAQMLQRAGITADHMLADATDWLNIPLEDGALPAMDSGAYRAFKAGTPISDIRKWCIDTQREVVRSARDSDAFCSDIAFVTMPDVLGNPGETWDRWCLLRDMIDQNDRWMCECACWVHLHLIPVWQWGGDVEHLRSMHDWAEIRGRIVAIGGCVPWMREKDESNLSQLVELAQEFGQRFHVLGLNWLEAMEQLDPLVRSCDTSKWLDGARYGTVIHDRDGHLVQEEKRYCGRGDDRESLCVESAETLHAWVNKVERGIAPEPARPKRIYVLDSTKTFVSKHPVRDKAIGQLQLFSTAALVNRLNYRRL